MEEEVKIFKALSNISRLQIVNLLATEGETSALNIVHKIKLKQPITSLHLDKLRKLGIFQSIKKSSGVRAVYGLDIIENGESREFVLKDVLSPILGYVGKNYDNIYIRPVGKKGLERSYNKDIDYKKNGYIKGKRDVLGSIIHDRNTIYIKRVNGYNLHLNIPLSIQRRAEYICG